MDRRGPRLARERGPWKEVEVIAATAKYDADRPQKADTCIPGIQEAVQRCKCNQEGLN